MLESFLFKSSFSDDILLNYNCKIYSKPVKMSQKPDQASGEQEEQFSRQRKSAMLQRHVTYEKQCLMCKAVSGAGFSAFGFFNVWRARSVWPYMGMRDKVFNIAAISVIFGIAALNFSMAYKIHMGQQMELIELRPSYSERFRQSYRYMNMSAEDKQAYLIEQIKIEEEKSEVQNYLATQKSRSE